MQLHRAKEGWFDKSWGFRADGLTLRHFRDSFEFLRRLELGSLPAVGKASDSGV